MSEKPIGADPTKALSEIAAAVERLADEVAALRECLPSYAMWNRLLENLRSDHPLQGQTFGEIGGALEHIAQAIEQIADK